MNLLWAIPFLALSAGVTNYFLRYKAGFTRSLWASALGLFAGSAASLVAAAVLVPRGIILFDGLIGTFFGVVGATVAANRSYGRREPGDLRG